MYLNGVGTGGGGEISDSTPADGAATPPNRVLRGGNWYYPSSYCCVTTREWFGVDSRNRMYGFRVVRTAK